jgi:hypothetical protein
VHVRVAQGSQRQVSDHTMFYPNDRNYRTKIVRRYLTVLTIALWLLPQYGIKYNFVFAFRRNRGWISMGSFENVDISYKKVGDGHPLRLWRVCTGFNFFNKLSNKFQMIKYLR